MEHVFQVIQDAYEDMTEEERLDFVARELGSDADELADHDRGLGLPKRTRVDYLRQAAAERIVPLVPDDIVA